MHLEGNNSSALICEIFSMLRTCTIFVISWMSMTPLPSTSYMRNAHFSFSSGVPLEVTWMACRNSYNKVVLGTPRESGLKQELVVSCSMNFKYCLLLTVRNCELRAQAKERKFINNSQQVQNMALVIRIAALQQMTTCNLNKTMMVMRWALSEMVIDNRIAVTTIPICYLEIDVSVLVHVECAEHMVAELDGIAGWEEHLVHIHELGGSQSAVGAILLQEDSKGNFSAKSKIYTCVSFICI